MAPPKAKPGKRPSDPRARFKEDQMRKAAAREEMEREKHRLAAAAAAAAEEERIRAAKQAEEEEKLRKMRKALGLPDEKKMKDIQEWVQSLPLSEPITKVERNFCDGVLVAEIIHHFCPSLCDTRSYFKWSSSINRQSNWELLNYKVFPKLGFKLKQHHIHSILKPFSCGKYERKCDKLFIYKLLEKVRDALAKENKSIMDYKKPNFHKPVPKRPISKSIGKVGPRRKGRDKARPMYSRIELMVEKGYYDLKEGETMASKLLNRGPDSYATERPASREGFSFGRQRAITPTYANIQRAYIDRTGEPCYPDIESACANKTATHTCHPAIQNAYTNAAPKYPDIQKALTDPSIQNTYTDRTGAPCYSDIQSACANKTAAPTCHSEIQKAYTNAAPKYPDFKKAPTDPNIQKAYTTVPPAYRNTQKVYTTAADEATIYVKPSVVSYFAPQNGFSECQAAKNECKSQNCQSIAKEKLTKSFE